MTRGSKNQRLSTIKSTAVWLILPNEHEFVLQLLLGQIWAITRHLDRLERIIVLLLICLFATLFTNLPFHRALNIMWYHALHLAPLRSVHPVEPLTLSPAFPVSLL